MYYLFLRMQKRKNFCQTFYKKFATFLESRSFEDPTLCW